MVTKIVLNASACDKMGNNDLAAFLRYVNGEGISGEFVSALDQEVQKIKSNKKLETAYMTFEMKLISAKREGFQEGKAEGIAEGKAEGLAEGITKGALNTSIAIAKKMLADGLNLEQIKRFTNLSDQQLAALK